MGPVYGGLEEAKADVTGMFGLQWLVEQGAMPKERLEEYYASYVAGVFRTLRFGTGEAHGKAELMEFNVLLENKALSTRVGRYVIDYARMPDALAGIAKQLLKFEARGDRGRRRGVVREVRQGAGRIANSFGRHERDSGGCEPGLFVCGRSAS